MAANMMEMLKQIQHDQKESIKYMHDKFNFVERKIIELDKKIDQQQVPIKRLEEQVRKNNTLLFGSEETEISTEDSATTFDSDNDKNLMESSTKNIDTNQLENASKTKGEDTKLNSNKTFKTDEFDAERKAAIENTAGISLRKQDIEVFSVKLVADQINQLDEKLDRITDMYQSDMREMKSIIKSFEAVTACFSQDQSNHLNLVLVRLTEMNQKELSGMKEFMKDYTERIKRETITEFKQMTEVNQAELKAVKEVINNFITRNMSLENTGILDDEPVKISPTYFSEDQISKLNSELKRIAETYQRTNKFPIIEVVPRKADNHPVLNKLRKGIYFETLKNKDMIAWIKLGLDGFTSSYAENLLSENPDLSAYDIVMEWLEDSKRMKTFSKEYDVGNPKIYNRRGNLVNLDRW